MTRIVLPLVTAVFLSTATAAGAELETVFVVVDDAPVHDAATGKLLGRLMRGISLTHWSGSMEYRTQEWNPKKITIEPESILPESAALKLFDGRIKAGPSAADYADRASIHIHNERYAKAERDLDEAIKLDPTLYRAYLRRAECYPWTVIRESIHDPDILPRRLELALKDAEKCLELRPNEFLSHLARFQLFSWQGDLRALPDGEKALELRPCYVPILNNSAKLLTDVGRRDEAMEKLNRALEIDPEYSDAYTNRGVLFHQARRFDRAIADATSAIKFNPLNTSAWNNRGNAYMETKEFEKAITDFGEVIRINRTSSDGYFGRANVYFSIGMARRKVEQEKPSIPLADGEMSSEVAFERAAADCRKALERNPGDFKCYNTLGNVLKQQNKPREAIEVFDKAMSEMAAYARAFPRKVDLWDAVEEALDFATEPSKFDAQTHRLAMSHPHRATIAAIMGNRADAHRALMQAGDEKARAAILNDLTRAITFDPQNADYFRVRGYYNLEFKRWEQAISDLTRATQLRPKYAEALRGRILALVELKKYDDAWEDVRTLEIFGEPLDNPTLDRLKKASGRDM